MLSPVRLCLCAIFAMILTATAQFRRKSNCVDTNPLCPRWALSGECYHNRGYMAVYCSKSCHQCNVVDPRCQDHDIQCAAWADKGECLLNERYMEKTCAKSCSICLPAGDHSVPHIHADKVREYWRRGDIILNQIRRRRR